MSNKIARNRRSPNNEAEYIAVYLKENPDARKKDGMDIAAVTSKDGIKGHGLVSESINRSHDKEFHLIKDFIFDEELKKKMK